MSAGRNSWRLNSEVHHEVAHDCVADRVPCVSGEPAGARQHGDGGCDPLRVRSTGVAPREDGTRRGSKPASPNERVCGVLRWIKRKAERAMAKKDLSDTSESLPGGVDKIERYKWTAIGTPGELCWINKRDIKTDYDSYQRGLTHKVDTICRNLDFMAFGCLTVARRSDGSLWVVDGNNRLHAAMRRSDISVVPCIVFDVISVEREAQGFIGANQQRKPVTAMEKFRALRTAGSDDHGTVIRLLEEVGMYVSADKDDPRAVRCVSQVLSVVQKYGEDESRMIFRAVHAFTGGKCKWTKQIVQGFAWLHKRIDCEHGIGNQTFLEHCRSADIERFNKAVSMGTIDDPRSLAGKAILHAVNFGRRKSLFGQHLLGK